MAAERPVAIHPALRILGYAGLIPFVILPLIYWQPWWPSELHAVVLFQLYSCLILGFMAGVLWPVLYQAETSLQRGVWAVSIVVASFVSFVLLAQAALLIQAGLFLLLRLYEVHQQLDKVFPTGYAVLRNRLTAIVIVCHLWLFLLVSG
ncbi:DUF3429 domain-containing protein [Lacimicrobium alkaliphilum]|uniref:DUF3429 domain-containing protein n=1 Tax=Lacimicrobium alkaliphilum TaxID=1526571 RepID=A0ABQ1QXQ8_9ALTE|nr:DUF3429 domain-containing protein [Lacimicrobium alkaliphilum]GGD49003.1 hypothetical protein GCM10011357_01270 [Lacimicrobium alkaliphilum]